MKAKLLRILSRTYLFALLAFLAGLYAISFSAGTTGLLGVLLAMGLIYGIQRIPTAIAYGRTHKLGCAIYATLGLITSCFLGLIIVSAAVNASISSYEVPAEFVRPDTAPELPNLPEGAVITAYQATITSHDNNLETGVFSVEESIGLKTEDGQEQVEPVGNWDIYSSRFGIITRQVAFLPPFGLCHFSCPEGVIRLVDFPKGTYYSANTSDAPTIVPFGTRETIQWSTSHYSRGIAFSYVIPRFKVINFIVQHSPIPESPDVLITGIFYFVAITGPVFIFRLFGKDILLTIGVDEVKNRIKKRFKLDENHGNSKPESNE